MKNNKGITIVALVITIVIMLIISGTVVSKSVSNLKMETLNKLYNDLTSLQDKVNLYYIKYGTIPIKGVFVGDENFLEEKNPNDDGEYYVIDLEKINNLSLSLKIKDTGNDVYIINETTHTIYYPKGVEMNGEHHYRLPLQYTEL